MKINIKKLLMVMNSIFFAPIFFVVIIWIVDIPFSKLVDIKPGFIFLVQKDNEFIRMGFDKWESLSDRNEYSLYLTPSNGYGTQGLSYKSTYNGVDDITYNVHKGDIYVNMVYRIKNNEIYPLESSNKNVPVYFYNFTTALILTIIMRFLVRRKLKKQKD